MKLFIIAILSILCMSLQAQTTFKDSLLTVFGVRFGTVENPADIQDLAPRPTHFVANYINPYVNEVFVPAGWRRVENTAQNVFQWSTMDSIADLAVAAGYPIRIHSLAWHSDLPPWLANGTWTASQKQAILLNHIDSVVHHFRTRYPSATITYTAVNEPLCKTATLGSDACYPSGLKLDFWSDVHYPGSTDSTDWIQMAFTEAHSVDPTAKLYLSDIATERGGDKPDVQYDLVTHLIAKGVPIDGVAYETHVPGISFSTRPEAFTAELNRYTALGLNVQVSEFEARLPDDWRTYRDSALDQQRKTFMIILDGYLHATTAKRDYFNLWGLWDSTQSGDSIRKGSILFGDFTTKPNYEGMRWLLANYSRTAPIDYPFFLTWTRNSSGNLNNDGTWDISKGGDTYQSFVFPTTGVYKMNLSAAATVFNGVYPSLQVRVDATPIDTLTIASPYMRQYALQSTISSGTHTITFTLLNPQSSSRIATLKDLNIGSPLSLPNVPPVTIITAPDTIPSSTALTLDGTKSYDGDNVGILSYLWSRVSGPTVSILSSNTPVARVVFSTTGTYVFSLTVTDTEGASTTVNKTVVVTSPVGCSCPQ